MNYKLRRFIVDMIDIIQKFIVAYCIITVIISLMNASTPFYTLRLLPIPFLSYLIQKKSNHIWSFLLLHCAIVPVYILSTSQVAITVIFCLYIVFVTIRSYYTKYIRNTSNNFYLVVIFIIIYISLSTSDLLSLMQFTFQMAILYLMLCILNLYLMNFSNYLNHHAEITNVPYHQIKHSNNVLVLFLGGIFLISLLIFYELPFNHLLILIAKSILFVLVFLMSLLPEGKSEDLANEAEQTEAIPVDLNPSYLFQIIEKLFILLIVIAMILFISYLLYRIYNYFYKKRVPFTTDHVEFLSPFTKKDAARKTQQKFARKLFGHSNNAMIRKHFVKAISSSVGDKTHLHKNLTPAELTELAGLGNQGIKPANSSDQSKLITEYYEKARYSNEECSREEVKRMKKMLK